MTRINVVPPQELCDQHLLAEYRELTRIPNRVKRRIEEGKVEPPARAQDRYVLGEGHVTFFYDKLAFLRKRYMALGAECNVRGFKVTPRWPVMPYVPELWKDYEPTLAAKALNRGRIAERLHSMKRQPKWSPRTGLVVQASGITMMRISESGHRFFVVGDVA